MDAVPHSGLLDAIDKICDQLTIALFSVSAVERALQSEDATIHLSRLEKAIEDAGMIVWTLRDSDQAFDCLRSKER